MNNNAQLAISGIVAIIFSIALSGCEDIDNCERYRKAVEDPQELAQLLAWADTNIFPKSFSRIDERPVVFKNFNPRLAMVTRLEVAPSIANGVFNDEFVQIIGKDFGKPDAVFIGSRPYRGLVIGRTGIATSWQLALPQSPPLETLHDRVGLVCVRPFD